MKTGEFGERSFLKQVAHFVRQMTGSKLPWDEDASDFPVGSKNVVINIDTFVASTDRLPGMSDAQIGRKTAVMTLSDLAAKGVSPLVMMLSASFPDDYKVENALEAIRGFSQYCLKNSVSFIGGDTGIASDMVLTGVGVGIAVPDEIVLRGGARPGDIIAVNGMFGLTSVAFRHLLGGVAAKGSLLQRALIAAYKPSIDLKIVRVLRAENAITSAMDSSDGLGITLNTMARHSGVAFELKHLPVAPGVEQFAEENNLDLIELVMNGGEEYVLVMTIPSDKWDLAKKLSRKSLFDLTAIGRVHKGSGVIWHSDAGPVQIDDTGYDSFSEWK